MPNVMSERVRGLVVSFELGNLTAVVDELLGNDAPVAVSLTLQVARHLQPAARRVLRRMVRERLQVPRGFVVLCSRRAAAGPMLRPCWTRAVTRQEACSKVLKWHGATHAGTVAAATECGCRPAWAREV